MRIIKLTLLTMFFGGILLTSVEPASAQPSYFAVTSQEQACGAIGDISPSGGDCNDPDGPSVNKTINVAINIISLVAGVIAVVMIIVSGFKYVTSQGDASEISNSKKTLIYAIVGLVVVVFAQFIVKYVLARALK
jgi:hypothetical protein